MTQLPEGQREVARGIERAAAAGRGDRAQRLSVGGIADHTERAAGERDRCGRRDDAGRVGSRLREVEVERAAVVEHEATGRNARARHGHGARVSGRDAAVRIGAAQHDGPGADIGDPASARDHAKVRVCSAAIERDGPAVGDVGCVEDRAGGAAADLHRYRCWPR